MELLRFPSRRVFSVRSIITFVLTVVITALLWTTLSSTPTLAADEATWNGASLQYDGNQFISMGEAKPGNSFGLPDNAPHYLYVAPANTSGAPSSATQKAYVIYFAPGASPPNETTATYVEYTYNPTSKTYTNPTNTQSITINTSSASTGGTSCAIEGIGWLACPAMTWLADGMDKVFNIIASFMVVIPLQTGNTSSTLYNAWNVARSIANVAFIIVFLIIIYAQLTNIQVSNYGLKKLLPRLIITAIAVNLSYFIAAIAVDISNILGYSIQDVFMGLQENITQSGTVDPAAVANINSIGSWSGFTAFVLSGGTAAVVGVTSAIAVTGGTAMAATYILLPLMLGLLLALIVVFLILAARQALIIILIIIAPLALIAYLLPNTEKWFTKWRDLFMTMLIFFPAFAVVFGGAQLAGSIIIQNANSITMQLLGMVVQVAPLFIAPLLLKLSGSVLGNVARLVNNPNKGLVDRTRNWSKDRAEWHRQRGIGGLDRKGNPLRDRKGNPIDLADRSRLQNPLRKSARYFDQRTKRLADRTSNAATASQTAYEKSRLYTKPGKYDMTEQKGYFEHEKEATHSHHAEHLDKARRTQGSLVYQAGIDARASKQRADASQNYTEAFYNNAQRDKKLAGGALHASGYKLELSKQKVETTGNHLKAYYDNQRTTTGTDLYASVKPLETSKLRVEAAQSSYTAMVDTMKSTPNNALHTAFVETERLKQAQQIASDQAAKTVLNYKSGKIDPSTLTARQNSIMEQMKADAITLSAEKQAANSAQYEIQRNIADVMTGSGPLTDHMLDIAQGVGGDTARVRAKAQAVQAARSLDNDALKTNVDLLKNEAQRDGSTIKLYSDGLLKAVLQGLPMYAGQFITPERTKAALQAQADEKNMSLFEKIRGSRQFDQAMVNEIVALNNGTFKGAGGFGMQDDPELNIDHFASEDEYWHALRVQRISNLANSNASGLSGLKFGWVSNSLADPDELKLNIKAALVEVARGDAPNATSDDKKAASMAKASLQGAYKTVRDALLNDDIRATMNDREPYVRDIEAELARIHGRPPVPTEPVDLAFNADTYDAEN